MHRPLLLVLLLGCGAKQGGKPTAVAPAEPQVTDGGRAPTEVASTPPTSELATSPEPASSTSPSNMAGPGHRLVVRVRGAGSITGRVVSIPPGIDCEIATNEGGTNEKECETKLPAGAVKLTFTPTGAAYVAQFSFAPKHEICPSEARGGKPTCSFTLDRETHVDVFPISVPPPAPAPRKP
jgi:hypothetical protein